ncbi:MAG: HaeII family restriction endonuclease [Dehalococcoidia bacterium]|nr:MAG: HaeII family restriction endonuclease [Dehalococcoidia bacterium]
MVDELFCKDNIEKMLQRSQTKIIFPIITFGIVKEYHEAGKNLFSDTEIRRCYEEAVKYMMNYLKHDLHIGGKYYDAYPSRNLPKYGVLKVLGNKEYELLAPYTTYAEILIAWIPEMINQHITKRLGLIPNLGEQTFRAELSADKGQFVDMVKEYASKNPTNFEILSFAVIKVHLEKFACKVYRDTRTSAHDKGVDLSTNFGVVYQIKKLKIYNKNTADNIYAELRVNFDSERLNDGNVILVIDDISKEIKNYLVNMKVQSISRNDILKLAEQFEDIEDREKVLRIVYEEFRREYASDVK